MTRKTPRTKKIRAARFEAYLQDADQIAFDLILHGGINQPTPLHDLSNEEHDAAIEKLAKRYDGPYRTTDLDDVLAFEEHWAKMNAAHMVGIALGMRLAGRLGGAR